MNVDIVFDTVGGETLKRSWNLFKLRGRVIIEFPPMHAPPSYNLSQVMEHIEAPAGHASD